MHEPLGDLILTLMIMHMIIPSDLLTELNPTNQTRDLEQCFAKSPLGSLDQDAIMLGVFHLNSSNQIQGEEEELHTSSLAGKVQSPLTRGSNLLCDRRGNRRSVQSFSSPSFLLKLEEDSNSSLLSALEAQKNSNPLFCTQIPFLYGPSPF
ncbi:hypothetical protein VNO77_27581 [Canavalia gladiata]|uniref:Uncharacterized protein n=1 Tax=Canavalia gladiata TaxID=3824 RepID=A0AAN9QAM5_CANGL